MGAAVTVAVGDGTGTGTAVAAAGARVGVAATLATGAGTRPASPVPVELAFVATAVVPAARAASATTVPVFTEIVGEGTAGVGARLVVLASAPPPDSGAEAVPAVIVVAGEVPMGVATGTLPGARSACAPPACTADPEVVGGETPTGVPTDGAAAAGTAIPGRTVDVPPTATGVFATGFAGLPTAGWAGETTGAVPTPPTGFGAPAEAAEAALGCTGRGAIVGVTILGTGLTGATTTGFAGITTTGFAGAVTTGLTGITTGGGTIAGLGMPGACAEAPEAKAASAINDTPT